MIKTLDGRGKAAKPVAVAVATLVGASPAMHSMEPMELEPGKDTEVSRPMETLVATPAHGEEPRTAAPQTFRGIVVATSSEGVYTRMPAGLVKVGYHIEVDGKPWPNT